MERSRWSARRPSTSSNNRYRRAISMLSRFCYTALPKRHLIRVALTAQIITGLVLKVLGVIDNYSALELQKERRQPKKTWS